MKYCMVGDHYGDCEDDRASCVVDVGAHEDYMAACWTRSSLPNVPDLGKTTL